MLSSGGIQGRGRLMENREDAGADIDDVTAVQVQVKTVIVRLL